MDNETLTQDVIAGASEPKRLFGMPTQNLLAIIMVFFLFMVSSGIYLFFKILEERGVKYDTTASVGEPDTWFKRLTWMGQQLLGAIFGQNTFEVKVDEIDQEFIETVQKLPEGGYFVKSGKVNFDTFLMLYKEIYTHVRAREVDNYNKLLDKRKKMVEENHEIVVKKEYAKLIIDAMRVDQQQLNKSQQIAAECLNKV